MVHQEGGVGVFHVPRQVRAPAGGDLVDEFVVQDIAQAFEGLEILEPVSKRQTHFPEIF